MYPGMNGQSKVNALVNFAQSFKDDFDWCLPVSGGLTHAVGGMESVREGRKENDEIFEIKNKWENTRKFLLKFLK